MKRYIFCLVSTLALLWSVPAWAMSCDEIMNMVQVHVPTNVIVQTMQDSGHDFSASEVQCLQNRHAPREIIAVARRSHEASHRRP